MASAVVGIPEIIYVYLSGTPKKSLTSLLAFAYTAFVHSRVQCHYIPGQVVLEIKMHCSNIIGA